MEQKKYALNVTNLKDANSQEDLECPLYIGEWCKNSLKKTSIEKKIEIVEYHWNDTQKFNKDFLYLQKLYESFLQELSNKLNSIHGSNHSLKYWRIVVGPWLMRFIIVAFDRWESIRTADEKYKISFVKIADFSNEDIIASDENNFCLNLQDDFWNNCLFFQLINGWTNISIKRFNFSKRKSKQSKFKLKFKLIDYFIENFNSFSNFFFKKKFFFIGTYFGAIRLSLLQLKLGQFPNLLKRMSTKKLIADPTSRDWKIDKFYRSKDIFSDILSSLIAKHIPKVYLEGFKEAVHVSNEHYQSNPDYIFTSNSFYMDDYFKIWLADKLTTSNCKLISGQHGGAYFTSKYIFFEDHQLKISDYMVTWGYSDKSNDKIIQGFNYKIKDHNFNYKLNSKNKKALIIGYLGSIYTAECHSTFMGPQNLFYLDDQYNFIGTLHKQVQNEVLFRPHTNAFAQKHILEYKNLFPSISIENSLKPITEVIKKNKIKICVVTANSTVFLEMLNVNFPTILFTNLKYDQIRDEAKPYYQDLKNVGIFFDNPLDAANQLNRIWTDINSWWYDKKTQNAVDNFCNRFTRRSREPLQDLYNIFKKF
jgi:putative transferase (TIGR04331 family)